MSLYAYITPGCAKSARQHSFEDEIKEFGEKLEVRQAFQGLDRYLPSPYYKKRFQDYRLIIKEEKLKGNSIACLIFSSSSFMTP